MRFKFNQINVAFVRLVMTLSTNFRYLSYTNSVAIEKGNVQKASR